MAARGASLTAGEARAGPMGPWLGTATRRAATAAPRTSLMRASYKEEMRCHSRSGYAGVSSLLALLDTDVRSAASCQHRFPGLGTKPPLPEGARLQRSSPGHR